MALTLTPLRGPIAEGHTWLKSWTALFSNSYPTGGEALTLAQLGFGGGADSDIDIRVDTNSGYQFQYDYTNHKLIARVPVAVYTATFDPASLAGTTARDDSITVTGVAATDVCVGVQAPAAIAASVDIQEVRVSTLNTIVVRLNNPSGGAVDVASGTWTFYVTAANGAAHEVPNATDLSAALTAVRVVARSKYLA